MRKMTVMAALMFLSACGEGGLSTLFGDGSNETTTTTRRKTPTAPGIPDRATLLSYSGASSCVDLENAIEDSMVAHSDYLLEQSRQYAQKSREYYEQYYNGGSGGYYGGTGGSMDSGSSGTGGGSGGGAGANAGAGGGPGAYTTTNTQVSGIDEADFVKNDGTRIFVVSGTTLRAVRSWPPQSISSAGSLQLDGRPKEMFLEGDRAVVFSNLFDAANQPSWCVGSSYCSDYYATATRATLIDVSDLSNLRVLAKWTLAGRYQSARKIGSRVFTVLNSPYSAYSYGIGVQTWVSTFGDNGRLRSEYEIDEEAWNLMTRNESLIRAKTIDDWVGRGSFTAQDGTVTAEPLDCASIHVPNGPAEYGTTSLNSFDLNSPAPAARTTIFARADELYMSQNAVYVTQRHWWWTWSDQNRDLTYVHKFDVSNPAAPAYEASGIIDGWIADQFSLDEHNGDLRVAHTYRDPTSTTWWGTTYNRVSVFRSQAGQLQLIGQTEPLAPGERVMSARFVGDTGYVVTFRQTDPLYTLNLSDPFHPTKVGELKVPGFSSYIHPIDQNHLLTIGTYQPENGAWNQRAVQLAIFDVSNLAAPVQKFVQLVGTAYSSSAAQADHRAFNYFPAKKTLAIPFTDWGTNGYSYTSELRLFNVDTATGFTSLGAFPVNDLLVRNGCDPVYGCWSWWWAPQVTRSVMADDYVYAVTTGGVRVAKIDDLANPIGTAAFPYSP